MESIVPLGNTILGDVARFREVSGPNTKPGTIEVHIIRPGRGSSGYYTENVLREACTHDVYPAGMLMHWDHPTRQQEKDQPARITGTIAAALVEAAEYRDESHPGAWDGPGPYALAEVRPKFREDLKWLSGKIGVSHYINEGEWKDALCPDGKKGRLITKLVASPFNSVDFVTIPGAGGHSRFAEILSREDLEDIPELIREIIRHEGGKWVLYTHDGTKVLGTFETEEGALDRERQIQFFKHKGEALSKEDGDSGPGVKLVVGFPKGGGGSETQSVIFLKDKWTPEQARAWLKKHDLKSGDMEETEDSYRFRQEDIDKYARFRTIAPEEAHKVESRRPRMADKQLSIRLAEARANDPELYDEIRRQIREELKDETVNESQKTKLTEAETRVKMLETENKTLKLKLAEKAARDYITAEIGKAKITESAGKALTEVLAGQVLLEADGSIDTVKFAEIVSKAIKAKQDEIAAILKEAGAGVHGNGGAQVPNDAASLKSAREAYRDTLKESGMSEQMANQIAGVEA
jgi:hypothetical protein